MKQSEACSLAGDTSVRLIRDHEAVVVQLINRASKTDSWSHTVAVQFRIENTPAGIISTHP